MRQFYLVSEVVGASRPCLPRVMHLSLGGSRAAVVPPAGRKQRPRKAGKARSPFPLWYIVSRLRAN